MKRIISLGILSLLFSQSLQAQSSSFSTNQETSIFTNIQYSESDYLGYLGGGIDVYSAPRMFGSLQTRLMIGGFAEFGGEDESGYEEGDGFSYDLKSRVTILGMRAGLSVRDIALYFTFANTFYSAEGDFGDISFDESESEFDLGLGARVHLGQQKKIFIGSELSDERSITFSVGFNVINR